MARDITSVDIIRAIGDGKWARAMSWILTFVASLSFGLSLPQQIV